MNKMQTFQADASELWEFLFNSFAPCGHLDSQWPYGPHPAPSAGQWPCIERLG